MNSSKEWIKELKSWIANSKDQKKFAEDQLKFWQRMHKTISKQLEKEQKWLKEAEANK